MRKVKTQSRLASSLGAGSQMHLQLIKNAQVQLRLSHSGKGVHVCAHLFLMAAGVDDPPDLGLNFKRKFHADVFLQSFYGKAKNKNNYKISGIWVLFPTARNKAFWIWFFSCNLWKFMIYDNMRDPLATEHSTGKDRLVSGIVHCCFVNTQYESQHLAARTWRISKGSNKLASAKNIWKPKQKLVKKCIKKTVKSICCCLKNIWKSVEKCVWWECVVGVCVCVFVLK